MKEITSHVHRSEATVLSWIRQFGFPAEQIGGIWKSNTDLLAAWYKHQLGSNNSGGPDRPRKREVE
jgi:hypothetical protein